MVDRVLRSGLVLAAFTMASAFAVVTNVPAAHAEPECLTGSYDFNRDGNVDYAAGLPGADKGAGAVDVALSLDGIFAPTRVQAPGLKAGDQFGAAVSEVAYYENEGEDARCSQLAVGAPGRDIDGKKDAGSVFILKAEDNKFTVVKELVQGKDGVPGSATAGARFGAALAAPDHSDSTGEVTTPLYIGAPGAAVLNDSDDSQAGAGEVVQLTLTGAKPDVKNSRLIQQGLFLPGTPEAKDALGASLAVTTNGVAIGAPGENESAGAVAYFSEEEKNRKIITQGTAGVPGASEAGDRFGSAVTWAPALPGGIGAHTLVGAPGEAVGKLADAGSVVVFNDELSLQGAKGYSQDTAGIAGKAEKGDKFGTSLATFGQKDLITGVPGEDIGSTKDAGGVNSLSHNISWSQDTKDIAGTPETGDLFGQSLANTSKPTDGNEPQFWSTPLVGVPGENSGAGLVYYGVVGDGLARETWTPKVTKALDHFGMSTGRIN